MAKPQALSPLFITFILLGLLEASRLSNMRRYFPRLQLAMENDNIRYMIGIFAFTFLIRRKT